MAKITYADKVALNENPSIADINKVNAADMNEIKTVVNGLVVNTNSNSQESSYSCDYSNKRNTYSTDETFTGKYWIDGKPIYRKVIYVQSLPNATSTTYQHNINNVDLIWVDLGSTFVYIPTISGTTPLPYIHPDSVANNGNNVNNIVIYDITSTNFRIKDAVNRSAWSAYITLEYTKTTD